MGFWWLQLARFDWLHFSQDVRKVMAEYWRDVDAILMGKMTYESQSLTKASPEDIES